MNRTELVSYAKRYREAITCRLWDQWTAIGGGGYAARPNPVTWAVDPEALILASTNLFGSEPRLKDTATAWIASNAGIVSISRLKRLQQEHGFGDGDALSDLAATLMSSSVALKSWNSLTKTSATSQSGTSQNFGTIRKDLVVRFDPGMVACLILKLRCLLGVSSRVEILFWLFYHARVNVSWLADATGWFAKTVQKTLNEMVLSGHVREDNSLPVRRYYANPSEWAAFFPESPPSDVFLAQHHLYRGVFDILHAMDRLASGEAGTEATKFLLLEALGRSYHAHQRARNSLVRESYATERLSDLIEQLVANTESDPAWPVGAFVVDPNRCRFG